MFERDLRNVESRHEFVPFVRFRVIYRLTPAARLLYHRQMSIDVRASTSE